MTSQPNQTMTERDLMEKISALEAALRTCSPNKMRDPCYSYPGSQPREPTSSHIEALQIWITSTSYVDYYTKVSLRLNRLKSLYESERLKAIREAEQLQVQQTHWPFSNQGSTKNPSSSSTLSKPRFLSARTKGSSVHDFRPHKQRMADFPVHFTLQVSPSLRAKSNLEPWAAPPGGVEDQNLVASPSSTSIYKVIPATNGGHESTSSECSFLYSQSKAESNHAGQYRAGSEIGGSDYSSEVLHEHHTVTPEYQPPSMPPTPLPNLGLTSFFEPAYLTPVLDSTLAMTELAQNWHTSRDLMPNASSHPPINDRLYADVMFDSSWGHGADVSMPSRSPSQNAMSTATVVPSFATGPCDQQPSPSTTAGNATSAFDSDEEYDC